MSDPAAAETRAQTAAKAAAGHVTLPVLETAVQATAQAAAGRVVQPVTGAAAEPVAQTAPVARTAARAAAHAAPELAAETVAERLAPPGMVTLKVHDSAPALAALGLPAPGVRRMVRAGDLAALWMAPDEVLVLAPDAGAAMAAMAPALAGAHHLMADVTDARAMFRIAGPRARESLAKLCPVDLHPAAFGPGDVRRTRAAQVAASLWAEGGAEDVDGGAEDFRLVAFRSVADYVAGLLAVSVDPAGAVGLFPQA